jgi:hypothetical protein
MSFQKTFKVREPELLIGRESEFREMNSYERNKKSTYV